MKSFRELMTLFEGKGENIETLLAPHQAIGWDVDGTILDHFPNAHIMHDYICMHPEKQHYIVTFRSHGMEDRIFHELSMRYDYFPSASDFAGILSVPYETYSNFSRANFSQIRGLDFDQGHVDTYQEWKGKICAEHGITALVDDDTSNVVRGCDKYGVTHIHPDDL